MSLSEWLTFGVGAASLLVSIATIVITISNQDTAKAVARLSDLAEQTKRQADGQAAQIKELKRQSDEVALQTKAISEQTEAIKSSAAAAVASSNAEILSSTAQIKASGVAISSRTPQGVLRGIEIEGLDGVPNENGIVSIKVKYWFQNIGGSTLWPGKTSFNLLISSELPLVPDYRGQVYVGGNELPVQPGQGYGSGEPLVYEITAKDAEGIKNGKTKIYAFGRIEYTDNWKSEYVVCYAYRVSPGTGIEAQLRPTGGQAYRCGR
jgi:hypothetical protein